MVGITERNQQKQELVGAGFSLRYIDEWMPKTTLYRHKASYDGAGNVSEDIGTIVKGVPGNPDYVLLKAKIGLFPWTPGESCECQWCTRARVGETKAEVSKEDATIMLSAPCPDCDFIASAPTATGAASRLRAHAKTHS